MKAKISKCRARQPKFRRVTDVFIHEGVIYIDPDMQFVYWDWFYRIQKRKENNVN